jgi:hypothetical protein
MKANKPARKNKHHHAKKPLRMARVSPQLRGHGDFSFSDIVDVAKGGIKSALEAGGSALGNHFMGGTGATLGKGLGNKLARLVGCGDYQLANDTAVNALIQGRGPAPTDVGASFSSTADIVRIRHREYVSDVITGAVAGAFNNTAIPVNPGLVQSFPYLANIAQNFEEYRFRGLVFEFVSSTSPYLASAAMGTLVVSMEYNPVAPPFTNKPQMENSDYAVSARFDRNLMYGVECKQFTQNSYLTRYQTATPLTAYDSGLFQVATVPGSTFPVNSVVGELWVSYDVELSRPRISPARFGLVHYAYGSVNGLGVYPTPVLRAEYGTLAGAFFNAASPNQITIPDVIAGDIYQISVTSSGFATLPLNIGSVIGLTPFNILIGGSSNQCVSTAGGNAMSVFYYTATGPTGTNASFTVGGATMVTVDLVITDLGNGLLSAAV